MPNICDVVVGQAIEEVVDAEEKLRSAQLSADIAALEDLIADDLLFSGPLGTLATRSEDLDAYRSQRVRFLEHEPLWIAMKELGPGVVFSVLHTRLKVDLQGVIDQGIFQYARVWSQRSRGNWKVVAGVVTPAPKGSLETPAQE